MYKVRPVRPSSNFFNLIVLVILVFSTFMTGDVGVVHAQVDDNSTYYYYANGNRILLTPSSNWISVKFSSDDPAVQAAALKNSAVALGSLDQARQIPHPKLTLLPLTGGVTKQTINSLRADAAFLQINPVFQTVDAEMAVTDEFIVTFPASTSMEEIIDINSSNDVEIVDSILGQENTFVLRIVNAQQDILSMANLYRESGVAIHSAPNFVRIISARPEEAPSPSEDRIVQPVNPMAATNDTYYGDEWFLDNTGQMGWFTTVDADIDAPEAWDHTTGSSSIIIAVIDEGVDLTHEDYSSKLVAGYDATGLDSGGSPSGDDAHGTNVAGIAAASSNNNLGVAGVCQNCKIMPVRIAYSVSGNWVTTDAILANGITWAYQNGADVLNNSWGGGSEATVVNTAISNAKSLGRGGKGAVVVFAAGNDDSSSVSWPGYLSDVIAVGASNICDQRKTPTWDICNGWEFWWGSNYGSALDISAPGVWLYSTDIMGEAGENSGGLFDSGNYWDEMNGTSGAAPIVSGIAGLMLSVNPSLTASQVQTILQNTADDVNGGGFDVEMGYGRVNANAAVQASNNPPGVCPGDSNGSLFTTQDNQNNAGSGVGDCDMDIYLFNTSPIQPIEFTINVPSGTSISSAGLLLQQWDVDETSGEVDEVYFNGHYAGTLTGANNTWSTTFLTLNPSWVVPGENLARINIDVMNISVWAVETNWGQLLLNGETSGTATISVTSLNQTEYKSGEAVQINVAVDTILTSQNVQTEINLRDPKGVILDGIVIDQFLVSKAMTGNASVPVTVDLNIPTEGPSGTYDIQVLVYDKTTSLIQDYQIVPFNLTGTYTFYDVPSSYWAWNYVERLYSAGITGGCGTSPLMYCPLDSVTRAQMAIFILRGIHGSAYTPPVATGMVFADVPLGSFAADWIEQLAAEGITAGCGGGNYCPNANITRAQMAIFLLRGEHGSAYVPPTASGIVFSDVPLGSFAADWIEQLATEGITSGCGGGNYCPNANVTRDQMAVFLVRAFNLP